MFGSKRTALKLRSPEAFLEGLGDLEEEYRKILEEEAHILNNATLQLSKKSAGAVTNDLPNSLSTDAKKLPDQIAGFHMQILNMQSQVSDIKDRYDGALVSVKTVDPELDLNNYRPHSFSPASSQEQAAARSHSIPGDIKGVVSEICPDGSFVVDPIGNQKKGINSSPLRIQPRNADGEPQISLKFL